MDCLDQLYQVTLMIKNKIHEVKFKENDVRKAYYENLYSIINEFYHGKIFFRISQEIRNKNISFDYNIKELYSHFTRIYEIADHPQLSDSYHNELNRKLYIDSFTNFETTLSLCFEAIASQEDLNTIIKDINKKLLQLCKNLPELEQERILNELKKTSFIPLSRKFRYLSKIQKECYPSNLSHDLEFIEFCSKLRNCLSHSAGYYKGKDYIYEFEQVTFTLKNNSFLEITGTNNAVFLKINEKLSNIINSLYDCLKHIDFIEYPDDGF